MRVSSKGSTKVKSGPAPNHPFRQPFSAHRLSAPDCKVIRPPAKPQSGQTEGITVAVKPPWHKRPLPKDWSAEEVQFFQNWAQELARLHEALTSAAAARSRVLWRARKAYRTLGRELLGLAQAAESALRKSRAGQTQDASACSDKPTQ